MSEKKHIDRLFQEKLKDFEATPDDANWNKIHDRLHEDKRKRRVIPIWWRVAGVAALVTLLFTVGINFISNDFNSDITNPVIDTENQLPNKSNETKVADSNNSEGIENQIENASDVASENSLNTEDFSEENSNETSNGESKKNRLNQNATTISKSDKNRIVNNDKSDSNDSNSQDDLNKERISNRSSKENKTSNIKNAVANGSKNDENNSYQADLLDNRKEKSEMAKILKDSKNDTDSKVANVSEKNENITSEEKREESNEETEKETIEDKSIEDAIAEANTEDEQEKKLNRWNISPNVAPVYFNSFGQGSTLDAQFVDNNKSSEVTMSYGIGGSYAFNDRLKVRAGINKVDMGYSTNNVIAFRSIDASGQARSQLDNVDMNANAENFTFLSAESINRSISPEIINSKSNGSINQRFGFIEVPLEMEYAVINKKIGVNVIGGFSTLIVDKNEIYSVVNGTETRIGEANNINNMSYSANFGLGINYNISEKIKVNVEPTFKYQMKTFSNSSGDFQPYFIGVYTGLSYKF